MKKAPYSIVLADDEDDTRHRLEGMIDESLGFQIIGSAGNGSDALDLIASAPPHVIITDIRMPYIDGLELAHIIRRDYPTIKIVFITGYGEFNYARQAVELGISSFLTKPVSREDIIQLQERLKKQLDEEHERRYNMDKIKAHYEVNLPFIIENYLLSILLGRHSWREIEFLKSNGISFDDRTSQIIAFVRLNSDNTHEGPLGYEGRKLSVRSTIHAILENRGFHIHTVLFNDGIVILIRQNPQQNFMKRIDTALVEVVQASDRYLNVSLDMGVSRMVVSAADICHAYEESLRALELSTFLNTGRIVYIDQIEHSPVKHLQLDKDDIKELEHEIRFGTEEALDGIITKLRTRIRSDDNIDIQLFMLKIANVMVSSAEILGIDLNDLTNRDLLNRIAQFRSGEQFFEWLTPILKKIKKQSTSSRVSNAHQYLQKAEAFMEDNLHDSTITIEKVCEYLQISVSYLSLLFKKDLNTTYIKLLTKLRINRAKELLLTTDQKIADIAELSGFSEVSYFSHSFKKQTGISPRKFREANSI